MSLHSSYCLLRPPAAVTCDQIQKLSLPEHMASAKPELMLESGDFVSSGIQGPGLKSQERGPLSWKLLPRRPRKEIQNCPFFTALHQRNAV